MEVLLFRGAGKLHTQGEEQLNGEPGKNENAEWGNSH